MYWTESLLPVLEPSFLVHHSALSPTSLNCRPSNSGSGHWLDRLATGQVHCLECYCPSATTLEHVRELTSPYQWRVKKWHMRVIFMKRDMAALLFSRLLFHFSLVHVP